MPYSTLSYIIEPSVNFSDITDEDIKNLTFPGGEIGQKTNITWGINEFGSQLQCVRIFKFLFSIQPMVAQENKIAI